MNDSLPGLLNYWVVICLMMTGFYIVIGQRNLIKSILGLNIFQTSVFLLYITMGKISGGTAPIVPPDLVEASADHAGHVDPSAATTHAATTHAATTFDTGAAGSSHGGSHDSDDHRGSHEAHGDGLSHSSQNPDASEHGHSLTGSATEFEANDHGPLLLYSNPLPSVLMLTAIVVGIATTALALALVVRVKEDYGTIEEDEILAIERAALVASERAALAASFEAQPNAVGQTESPTA